MSGRPRLRTLAAGVGWAGVGTCAVLTVLHSVLGDGVMLVVWFHALTAWWPLLVLPFLGLAAVLRRPDQLALGAVTVLGWLWFNRPPPGADSPGSGPVLRLASANQLMVNPDPDGLVAELLGAEPDVLVVQEFTPELQTRLQGRFPYSIERPAWHSFGGAVYSRFPIVAQRALTLARVEVIQATLDVEGQTLAVWNVHTLPPASAENHADWLVQVESIAALAARETGALVVAGDFNLTRHHQGYRTLTASLDDAHRRCGRWTAWTWPNGGVFGIPLPRLRLDHVLLKGAPRCAAIRELSGVGSDHRPIVVDLTLGPTGTSGP